MKAKHTYRVLVVEDDDEDFMLVEQWLKQARGLTFIIDWVSSYAAAKKYLTLDRPDIILSNFNLNHHRTGLDLANWLWARSDNIPMLLMSGNNIRDHVSSDALHKVVVNFLPKSDLSAELLETHISRVIQV